MQPEDTQHDAMEPAAPTAMPQAAPASGAEPQGADAVGAARPTAAPEPASSESPVDDLDRAAANLEMPLAPMLAELARSARSVGFMDVADWAESERQGYRTDVPPYRRVSGLPMGFNPLRGWVPIYIDNRALLKRAGAHCLRQGITAIEEAIAKSKNHKALIHYSAEQIALINAAAGTNYIQMASSIDIGALEALQTSVRSLTRHWQTQLAARMRGRQNPEAPRAMA